jgi:hypothetical protein
MATGGANGGAGQPKSKVRIVSSATGTAAKPTVIAKKTATIDTYIMDQFIISTMKKNEAAVKRAAKKTTSGAGTSDK